MKKRMKVERQINARQRGYLLSSIVSGRPSVIPHLFAKKMTQRNIKSGSHFGVEHQSLITQE